MFEKTKLDKWQLLGIVMCWLFVILGLIITCVRFVAALWQVLILKHHPRE